MGSASEDPLALLPELLLLAGAVTGLLVGLWSPQGRQGRVRVIALAACAASAVAAVTALGEPSRAVFDGTWTVDLTTGVVRVSVAVATGLAVMIAGPTVDSHPRQTEFYVLMLLGGLGAVALGAASDLLLLVAGYLLASVPLYALAGFAKDSRGVEATMKYYLVGALVGVLMLVGVSTLVLATGSTGYVHLAEALGDAPTALVAVGVLGVVAGVLFKAGAVPVHFWVPDVTDGATTPSVTSGTQKCTGTAPALNSTPATTPSTPTATSAVGVLGV